MRLRPGDLPSEFRLCKGDREIGYIKGAAVGFGGFRTETDAAQAAYTAHRALGRRWSGAAGLSIPKAPEELLLGEHRGGQYVIARSGLLARLIPPDPDHEYDSWGFEISLHLEEHATAVAMSCARTMWQALRGGGWPRRMRQFSTDATASGGLGGPLGPLSEPDAAPVSQLTETWAPRSVLSRVSARHEPLTALDPTRPQL